MVLTTFLFALHLPLYLLAYMVACLRIGLLTIHYSIVIYIFFSETQSQRDGNYEHKTAPSEGCDMTDALLPYISHVWLPVRKVKFLFKKY